MQQESTIVYKPIETILDKLTCRSLVIWGDDDLANVTLDEKKKIKTHDWCLELGLRSVVIEHCGHDSKIHKPEEISNLILDEF